MARKYNTLQIRKRAKEHTDTNKLLLELPTVKNIISLMALPPHLQCLPHSQLTHGIDFSVEHDCAFSSNGELGLRFVMRTAMNGKESIEDFTTRSALQLANFFNALVIPVFLLATLKTQNKTPPPILQEWRKAVTLTYKYATPVVNTQRATVPLVHVTTHDAGKNVHFFAATGEDIKQQLSNLERITENRIKSLEIGIVVPNTLINAYSLEFALYNAVSLNKVAFYMQLLPLYRSILANSARDYGITLAPYKLGVGCTVLQEGPSQPADAPQDDTLYYKQTINCCVFIHGVQAQSFSLSSTLSHNSSPPIKMPMFTLFEVSNVGSPGTLPSSILPYICTVVKDVEYYQVLKQFLAARKIVVEAAHVSQNLCTVLRIAPNPQVYAKKACSLKSLAEYLYLLTSSGKVLFGNKHRVMAYAQTVQSVNGIPDVTVLHILDAGTQPKKQRPTFVSDTPNVLICDEACHRVMSDPKTAIPRDAKEQIAQILSTLSKLFSKAARNPKDNTVKAIYRGFTSKHSIDVRHFLETGKVQCVVILQNLRAPANTVRIMRESAVFAHTKTKNKATGQNSLTYSQSAATAIPRALPPAPTALRSPVTPYTAHSLPSANNPINTGVIVAASDQNHAISALPKQNHKHFTTIEGNGLCHSVDTNVKNSLCTAHASFTDKSLHLDHEVITLPLINVNKELTIPPSPSEPAADNPQITTTEDPQPTATSVAYQSRLSQTFRDALCTILGTMTVVSIVGLTYFSYLRHMCDPASMFECDLIVGVGLSCLMVVVAAAMCTVMVREVSATRRALRFAIMGQEMQDSAVPNREIASGNTPQQFGTTPAKPLAGFYGLPGKQLQTPRQRVLDADVPVPDTEPKTLANGNIVTLSPAENSNPVGAPTIGHGIKVPARDDTAPLSSDSSGDPLQLSPASSIDAPHTSAVSAPSQVTSLAS